MQITKRVLTIDEATLLKALIKETRNITGYSISELTSFSDVLVAEKNNELVGVCINKNLLGRWSEIAVLYVIDKERGKGIGRKLFDLAYADLTHNRRNIYSVSKNPIVIKLMKEKEMKIVNSLYMLPILVNIYNLTFAINVYRIEEYIRKNFRQGIDKFVYAYKRI